MSVTAAPIFATGVYDMPAEEYHRDPVPGGSLSSTGARKLLAPSCPALFRHWQQNPQPPKREFDFGHAAHKFVLGDGPEIFSVPFDDWKSKAAREQRDYAYSIGVVPLLEHEVAQVHEMADALRRHPVASALFSPERGKPEQTLIWRDEETGVWRRARLDWLPDPTGGRLIAGDYKTANSADLDSIQRSVYKFGYHMQAAWYLDGLQALGFADFPAFVFVFQEKTPPYLITVIELDVVAQRIGRERNRKALEIYRDCTAADHWPGHATDIELIALPGWAEARHDQEFS